MKMTVKTFAEKLLALIGDSSLDLPEPLIINGLNWCFNELPRVPKLGRLFSRHYTTNLDAEGHYSWNLNQDFRRIGDVLYLNFWTSTGGEPCRINVCYQPTETFYQINGLPEMRRPGTPCAYTIEVEGDDTRLVFDRPLNIPMIIDYIATGYLKPVSAFSDEIELSAIAENLIIGLMRTVIEYEGRDYAWARDTLEYLDNKAVREAIQELNKRYKMAPNIVLGES